MMENEKRELKSEQLEKVIGGNDSTDSFIPKNNNEFLNEYNNFQKQPKISNKVACEPYFLPTLIMVDGKKVHGQKPSCSDRSFKGTKPECQNCCANK